LKGEIIYIFLLPEKGKAIRRKEWPNS